MDATSMLRLLVQANPVPQSVDTPFGTIPADMGSFVSTFAKVGIGFGGVAAIAMITIGAVTILTSTGNPDKLMEGRGMITNALVGLTLVVLALFVLQLLGWDILGIGRLTGVQFNSWT